MGTHALIKLIDDNAQELACIYVHWDGDPSCLGTKLARILAEREPHAHDFACLAATVVHELKDGPRNVYLYPPGTTDCGEAYVYWVMEKHPVVELRCLDAFGPEVVYAGPAADWEKVVAP